MARLSLRPSSGGGRPRGTAQTLHALGTRLAKRVRALDQLSEDPAGGDRLLDVALPQRGRTRQLLMPAPAAAALRLRLRLRL
jgi:hypothetical protein